MQDIDGITLAAVATAAATIALGYFTWVLARETRRLSAATAQAHVVATLETNQWAFRHVDLVVSNTGNAAAHKVSITFIPAISLGTDGQEQKFPFQQISVLKPGQSLLSHVGSHELVRGKVFEVHVKWAHQPNAATQTLSYRLDMNDYDGVAQLGERSPLVQIARELKKLREDWQHVAAGNRKIEVNSFSEADREKEAKEWDEYRNQQTSSSDT